MNMTTAPALQRMFAACRETTQPTLPQNWEFSEISSISSSHKSVSRRLDKGDKDVQDIPAFRVVGQPLAFNRRVPEFSRFGGNSAFQPDHFCYFWPVFNTGSSLSLSKATVA
jgi:hypothetical protein